jgi:hypothetical protein
MTAPPARHPTRPWARPDCGRRPLACPFPVDTFGASNAAAERPSAAHPAPTTCGNGVRSEGRAAAVEANSGVEGLAQPKPTPEPDQARGGVR